jgi:ribonuclease P protein component
MYQFKKIERLHSKKLIDLLYLKGNSFLVFPLKITYLIDDSTTFSYPPAQVLMVVSRKRYKTAVKRNRIKRLLREAYRYSKPDFYEGLKKKDRNCFLSISYVAPVELPLQEIITATQIALKKIITTISD